MKLKKSHRDAVVLALIIIAVTAAVRMVPWSKVPVVGPKIAGAV